MIIDIVSDLHGFYPKLDGGDLLIVAGDLTGRDAPHEYNQFARWIRQLEYKKKIVIAGNHDNWIIESNNLGIEESSQLGGFEYLYDSGTEFSMGSDNLSPPLKIWGSPWTKTFPRMNPHCKAFTVDTEEELESKWKLIPDDIDILVTHSPAYAILDGIQIDDGSLFHVGSTTLRTHVERIKPKLHVCGHVHEGYGQLLLKHAGPNTICVNASHVNERYKPVNKPIRIEL